MGAHPARNGSTATQTRPHPSCSNAIRRSPAREERANPQQARPLFALVADGRQVPRIGTARFSDIEWEHVPQELRFGPHYRPVGGLDPTRMNLYRLAQYLSLVEGPLRLLDGDFPHRDAMRDIAEQNIERTLTC